MWNRVPLLLRALLLGAVVTGTATVVWGAVDSLSEAVGVIAIYRQSGRKPRLAQSERLVCKEESDERHS
jgi:hypothetical protein